jgi:hypothetical protein
MLALRPFSWLAALALLSTSAGESGVELRWKLAAGEVLRYRTTMEQSMEMSGMTDMGMENSMAFVMRQEVKSIDAGGTASLELTTEALRMLMSVGAEEKSFDSTLAGDAAAANDPELAKMIQPMLDAKFGMKLQPDGKISELSGMKEMLAKAMEELDSEQSSKMFEQMFSEDSMRKMLELNVFPAGPIEVGATWKQSHDQPFPFGKMRTEIESKLESQEARRGSECARIRLVGKLSLESDAAAELPFSISMKEGELTGTMWFDTEHGRLVEHTHAVRMKLSMGAAASEGESENGMAMDMTTHVTNETVLLAQDAPAFESANAGGK